MPIQSSCARFGLGSVRVVRPNIALGNADSNGNPEDAFVTKYDTLGGVQWASLLRGVTGAFASDLGYAVTVDTSGNVYVTGGYISATLTIYNADETVFGTLTNSDTNTRFDAFVLKYNPQGIVQWSARIIGGGGNERGLAITTDSSGNVYVVGLYTSSPASVISSNGTTLVNLAASDPSGGGASADTFFVKYNSSGIGQWATRIIGTGTAPSRDEVATGILISGTDVYIVGYYNSAVIFNNPNNSFTITLSGTGVFIGKYNTDGFLSTAVRISNTSDNVRIDMDSSGNLYVMSWYSGTPTVFNSTGGTIGTLPASNGIDTYIVKFSTSFSILATFRVSGSFNEFGRAFAIDRPNGSVYVVGYYDSNPVTFINSDNASFSGTLANLGGSDVFVVKYDTSGFTQWAARIGGISNDDATAVCVDANGNIYVTGTYQSTPVTVYNANGTTFGTLANGAAGGLSNDVFVVKYNSSGVVQWAARMVGTTADIANGIAADSGGNVYLTGGFKSPLFTIYSAGF